MQAIRAMPPSTPIAKFRGSCSRSSTLVLEAAQEGDPADLGEASELARQQCHSEMHGGCEGHGVDVQALAPEQEGQRKFQSEGGASQDRGNASANRLRPEDKMPEAFKRRCIQDGDVAIQRRSLHPGDFGLELAGPEVKEAHLQAQQGQSPERATTTATGAPPWQKALRDRLQGEAIVTGSKGQDEQHHRCMLRRAIRVEAVPSATQAKACSCQSRGRRREDAQGQARLRQHQQQSHHGSSWPLIWCIPHHDGRGPAPIWIHH
mmetsp:Transcript_45251/g.105893  ORF Transcript_45251/g.105893 Transcript_45251/m.105893 type:complete len:263 (-) Transcript_45251:1273-2061(-)